MTVSRHAFSPVVTPEGDAGSWVERERLVERLGRDDVEAPVLLVSGPAGSGKSTLIRQWLRTDGRYAVEIAISAGMDDPAALAGALVDALERIGPEAPDTRASISGQEPAWSSVVLPALARLTATRLTDFVLVVDDVHLLRNPACQGAVSAVAGAVPPGSRVVLVSREEAPRFLGLARAEGRLLELEPVDLAFDLDEAATLFERLAVPIGPTDLVDAVERAEGWAVGLYLHALAMRGHGADGVHLVDVPTRRGPDGFVFDYIGTQILDRLDPADRHFLTRTAVLDELVPELCDAVLGRNDSVAVLPVLCDRIQLVIPLDGSGRRFRYHHLFRDALLSELTREAPAELVDLHARAARWFAEAGDRDSAVRHAKATHDRNLIADAVWPGVPGCLTTGSIDRLAGWLRDVPETDVLQDRRLTMAEAWLALQSGDSAGMDRWLLHAQGQAGPGWRDRARTDELDATLACAVALVGRDGLADSVTLCEAADSGLPADSGFRSAAAFIRGVCLTLQRDYEAGPASLVTAERLARALDQPLLVADAMSWQGLLALAAGDQRQGSRLILGATDVIRDRQLERLATSAHCITAQALALALNHDPAAVAVLGAARRLTAGAEGIAPWFAVCGRLVQAQAAVALGDGSLARLLISEAKSHMNEDLSQSLASDFLAEAEASLALLSVDGVSAATLSPAEIRVLQFLPSHLSIPQIGEHLFLSPNTVKSHTLAIYRKFGVSSRDEAVERAQRLGLVEASPRD